MAYPKLTKQAVVALDEEYGRRKANHLNVSQLEQKIERRLNKDIRTAKIYLGQHQKKIAQWLSDAKTDLKQAQAAVAAIKKEPANHQNKERLRQLIEAIAGYGRAMDTDVNELAEAWLEYREDPIRNAPASLRANFNAVRGSIINSQKGDTVKRAKLEAARLQALALLKLEAKATMKAGIKAGGDQRAIGVAQQAAREVVAQMDNLLDQIINPVGYTPAPGSVTESANNLVKYAGQKSWFDRPTNLTPSRGLWSKVEQGYTMYQTRTAAMEKILVTQKRSFRSNELSDSMVKAELAKAEDRVKQAKAIVKQAAADYKKGKPAIAKIEAGFKKKK
jgi:hypothetical protein